MRLYPRLVRHVFQPLALWRSGDLAQLDYLREYERTQFLSPDELRDLQFTRLRELLAHAHDQCPFYRERLDAAGIAPQDVRRPEDFLALPLLDKRDIQEQRDRMVARDWPRQDLLPYQTGGSTGCPLSFYLSRARKQSRAAATLRHNRWAGWEVGDRVAILWGAPGDAPPSGWRWQLRRALIDPHLFLNAGHLTEEKLAAFQRQLFRYRPRIIQAYAQAAALFARYLKARGESAYRPHAIVTSAEVLDEGDRRVIEEVFGCPVFNRYGCREVSVIASECAAHNGLHIMAEGIYVEVLNGARPARPGEPGAIVVTDLLNRAMPLIRYRIGDVATWDHGPCPCGRGLPRLRNVAGRVADFLVGSDRRLVAGPFLAHALVAERPSLGQVQIHQREPGKVLYRVRPGRDFRDPDDLVYLRTASRKYLGAEIVVDWELVEQLSPEPSGKFLFCRSSVTPDFLQVSHSGRS